MSYVIEFEKSAAKAFKKLDAKEQRSISETIDGLQKGPRQHGAIKLKGETNLYRVRAGDYRIVYQIHDQRLLVLIVRIAHRREVYR